MRKRWKMIKGSIRGVSFFILLFGLATVAQANSKEEGMYFSVSGVENKIGGDFTGAKCYRYEESSLECIVPEIETDQGFGITIGAYNGKLAGEFSYLRSTHNTNYFGSPYDGDVELLNFDIKFYMLRVLKQNIKAYFLTGVGLPRITIENAATDGVDMGDAIYKGFGLNLGLGTEIRVLPNLGIDGSMVIRGMRINRIEALGKEMAPEDNFYATGRSYQIKLNYYF